MDDENGIKQVSTARFYCYGVWANGIRQETYNVGGVEANAKMLEYKANGAIKVGYGHMPTPKRTKWGAK